MGLNFFTEIVKEMIFIIFSLANKTYITIAYK